MTKRELLWMSAEQLEDLRAGAALMRCASRVIWSDIVVGIGFADESRQVIGDLGEPWDPSPKVLQEFESQMPKSVL